MFLLLFYRFTVRKQFAFLICPKVIPIIGGVVSGGLTFATYRPMACKLKDHLAGLPTASVEFYEQQKKVAESNAADDEYIDVSIVEEDAVDEK